MRAPACASAKTSSHARSRDEIRGGTEARVSTAAPLKKRRVDRCIGSAAAVTLTSGGLDGEWTISTSTGSPQNGHGKVHRPTTGKLASQDGHCASTEP